MNFLQSLKKSCCGSNNVKITLIDTIPFIPPIYNGIVVKVYDGDTITIASKLPYKKSPMYRFKVRLNRIDTAEIRTKDLHEKEMAIIARDTLRDRIMNNTVILKNISTEKYGRLLADVYYNDVCMNDWLLEKHLAVVYDGRTKTVVNWENMKKLHKHLKHHEL